MILLNGAFSKYGMGAFLGGAEYEVETKGVTASHRGMIKGE
jgi:hypothetical protein